MDSARYSFKQLGESETAAIENLIVSVFSGNPWNDDWSDKNQLHRYINDLTGQNNSLTFGLYEETDLIGVSMGYIRHWYTGTEYYIHELCIRTSKQGKGIGTQFIDEIEKSCRKLGLSRIFLLTDSDVPAYEFYKKRGFYECKNIVAFAKRLL